MGATETKTKIVNKWWLEKRIKELNDWLFYNPERSHEKWLIEHRRNYYVQKFIEMEENNFKMIQI